MEPLVRPLLIVGLGNPGEAYKKTRHNVGFSVVQSFAKKYGFTFRHASHCFGELAQGMIEKRKVLLLLPTTFMNLSGDAVKQCTEYYKVSLDDLLVVCDDVALPLGALRMRTKGSSGGHNGLKSIEARVGTQYYARLRIGVGAPTQEDLADFVLARFSSEEQKTMEMSLEKCVGVLHDWVLLGVDSAMQKANTRETEEQSGERDRKGGEEPPASLPSQK